MYDSDQGNDGSFGMDEIYAEEQSFADEGIMHIHPNTSQDH